MKLYKYHLKGINCTNCAAKIQDNIREIEGIDDAQYVFATERLSIYAQNELNRQKMTEKLTEIVHRHELAVEVVEIDNNDTIKDSSSDTVNRIVEIGVCLVLFAGGLLLGFRTAAGALFLVAAYMLSGWKVILSAARNIIKGSLFDENFLMSIATVGALAIGELPEAAAVMVFYLVGSFFEDLAVRKSKKSISDLMDIRPDFANLKTSEGIIRVDPTEVTEGSVIIVKPGERVPLDGIIVEGSSELDTSSLTGEPAPRSAVPGDSILSGFINGGGLLTVSVTKTYESSTVSRILELVQSAASRKSPTENFITRFSKYYTPAVIAAASATAIIPPLLTGGGDFRLWLNRALVFLVVSCPCALVVSIPLSFFGGIGRASRRGILVKGSSSLEALKNVRTVVFDKTGTLTQGKFKVDRVNAFNGFTNEVLLEMAAAAEANSSHPLARSIVEAATDSNNGYDIKTCEEVPGFGVKAEISGSNVVIGNERLMLREGLHEIPSTPGTAVHVAIDGNYAGNIILEDLLKPGSQEAVTELRKLGVEKLYMLTGDQKSSAEKTGRILGLDKVFHNLLPDQKVDALEKIMSESKTPDQKRKYTAFIGDGINDAPVLAAADLGVAMGALGSDAAIEAADIVLMNDEPGKMAEAIVIAKQTGRIVIQNIILALGIKVLVMVLGTAGLANMWEAVFADVGVTVLAVLNTLRLLKPQKS